MDKKSRLDATDANTVSLACRIIDDSSSRLSVYTFRVGTAVRAQNAYDDYDVICSLGQGGFGQVKKALNKKTGGFVAIKEIRLNTNGLEREAISREIQILKGAQHPNIVAFEKTYAGYNKMSTCLDFFVCLRYS